MTILLEHVFKLKLILDEAISKATQNGAVIVRDKLEFDEFYLAYLVDPTGLGFGMIQNK